MRKQFRKEWFNKDIQEVTMKKVSFLTIAICLLTVTFVNAQVGQNTGSLGLGIDGGILIPVSGDVTANDGFGDYFGIGPNFGIHAQYNVIKELSLRTGFTYSFMKMDDEKVDEQGLTGEPYFTSPYIYLDGVFNLGNYINQGNSIFNPYAFAGCGMYFWKITDDGVGGDAIVLENGEEFKKTSFGMRFGAGVEVFATPQLSVFAEGKYAMIFSEDTDKFGDDFGNMGLVEITGGLTYYFPLGKN